MKTYVKKIESSQCNTALTITDVIKGNFPIMLYDELGLESFNLRHGLESCVCFIRLDNLVCRNNFLV